MKGWLVALGLALAGCSTAPTLDTMQRDIQTCIALGGHPRLGPEQTVVCRP